ncbi:S8 family peptidase [Enhygromyxa salina]|uniref:S8 family peptidase n=1 Tax=Enhygromyxa salina TaxID=215803 RepID=UPI0015E5CA24|nr:S8 family peptidase [Enhygromyxa salina]
MLGQIDELARQVATRAPGERDVEAQREVVAVHPEPDHSLPAGSLADRIRDVVVVGEDPDSGTVILDAASSDLGGLRNKIRAFGDDSKRTPTGKRKHEALVATMNGVALAELSELSTQMTREALQKGSQWLEIVCRGGVYARESSELSERQLSRQLERMDESARIAATFLSTTSVVFYVQLTFEQLAALVARVDCIYEVGLARKEIRDWLYFEHDKDADLGLTLTPPPESAPTVVLLDSGIADWHPLLAAAIRSTHSVVPGIDSAVDVDGHGTGTAGVALHLDGVGDLLAARGGDAHHWISSVKLLTSESSSSDGAARAQWPPMTVDAVRRVEASGGGPFIFATSVTAPIRRLEPTMWSQAIEQLAWNDGEGRLILISAGNIASNEVSVIKDYPQLNLIHSIEDPAQAWNALTVGAVASRDDMPPEEYPEHEPVGEVGGIYPLTTSRPVDSDRVPNKPEVVLGGGNVAYDGYLPDATVPTLTTLTAGHRRAHPLASMWATSEATARAAHLAARIWRSDPSLRPATVRGLIAHSASWTEVMKEQFESLDDRLRICGFGLPDPELAIACTRSRATVIVEDVIPSGHVVQVPKDPPPKRPDTPKMTDKIVRLAKFFRLPVPQDLLLAHPQTQVELRVTLSYFAEIHTFRRRSFRGLDLRWDMQGPQEKELPFRQRINKLLRARGSGAAGDERRARSFAWDIGPQRRQRGTVQSDRWRGDASYLAGHKLIAVMPRLGWWNERAEFRTKELPFSLIVTIEAEGLDLYTSIAVALEHGLEIPV